jgi:hypothetical protein
VFDERDVFLGASDTPQAPLHSTVQPTREWAVFALACNHILAKRRSR